MIVCKHRLRAVWGKIRFYMVERLDLEVWPSWNLYGCTQPSVSVKELAGG